MKACMKFNILLMVILFVRCSSSDSTQKSQINEVEIKTNKVFVGNLSQFILNSEKKLNDKYHPITEKTIIAPSGNKHDYVSRAVYCWPNPNTKDSLPWVYRDGQFNVTSLKSTDHSNYYKVMSAIRDLSLSFYLTNREEFAQKAFQLISMWFINNETKMNPNFNFAQGVPGISEGSPSGIIDSRAILWVIDAFNFMKNSKYFNQADEEKFKLWCVSFNNWLLNSDFGKREAQSTNNHGTFYDVQTAKFASFTGNDSLVIAIIDSSKLKRIATQIKPDGSMPLELERAEAFTYTIFSLNALFHLAILGENYNIDLWNYESANSGSIKSAFDFLINNAIIDNNWNFKGSVKRNQIIPLTYLAGKYIDEKYSDIFENLVKSENSFELANLYFLQ